MTSMKTLLLATACAVIAVPASAQKSADNMRIAVTNTMAVLSQYVLPTEEASTFYNRVWESLIAYDERTKKFVPILAKSWTRVNPTTIEFDLVEGRKFHNGNVFDADDVVGMLNYLADPKTALRYKDRYDWVKLAEKLGPYKVRVTTTGPNAVDLGNLAHRYNIYDMETFKALAEKEDYGRLTPHGTGVYKLTSIDKNKGMFFERFDDYNGNKQYNRATTKRVHAVFLPDKQTQLAQLLTGGVDVVKNVGPDQAKELARQPNVAITSKQGGTMTYMVLDSTGVAGNKALADVRVREAIHAAIDRDAIIKHIIPGGEGVAIKLDVPCFESVVGCKATKKPPAYDPQRAKKLLADAGYPNGFDMVYDVYTPLKDIAIAIAGDLRKIGIRASVVPDTMETYRNKQGNFQLQAWSLLYPIGSFPDASQALSIWFQGKRAEYFNSDPIVLKAMREGLRETDLAKREEIYKVAFDRIAEMRYVLPISSVPSVYAHGTDVAILDSLLSTADEYIGDFAWK